jgi:hypothetical protein
MDTIQYGYSIFVSAKADRHAADTNSRMMTGFGRTEELTAFLWYTCLRGGEEDETATEDSLPST